jgi:hypothetical protein
MRSRSLVAALVLLTAAGAVASAGAARGVLTVSPSTVHRGGLVQIRGSASGCSIGDTVTIMSRAFRSSQGFAGVPAVFANVGLYHTFHTTARIRPRISPGTYGINARCGGGNLGVTAQLHVLR